MRKKERFLLVFVLVLSVVFSTGFTIKEGLPTWAEGRRGDSYILKEDRERIKDNINKAWKNMEEKGLYFSKGHRNTYYVPEYRLTGNTAGLYSFNDVIIASTDVKTTYHEIGHAFWFDNIRLLKDDYIQKLEEVQPGITNNDTKFVWAWDIREDFAEEFAKIFTGRDKRTNYPDIPDFEEWLINKIKNEEVTRDEVFNKLGGTRELIKKGIVIGNTKGDYMLNTPITRAEIATVLVRLNNLENEKNTPFNDIKGKWYEGYVKRIYNEGLIKGYPDKTFRGNNRITRYELHKILERLKK